MPEITAEDITKVLKDALYVAVGAGVIGFQKAQVKRVELTKALTSQLDDAKGRIDGLGGSTEDILGDAKAQVAKLVDAAQLQKLVDSAEDQIKLVDERVTAVEEQLEAIFDQLEDKLPEPARDVVKQVRVAAKDARTQVRSLVNRAA